VSRRARGSRYEKLARDYLESQGYRILASNYRFGRKELDLVCADQRELVFVEVKGGSSLAFGDPVYRVDGRKQQAIAEAAQGFLAQYQEKFESCRFDVIVVRDSGGSRKLRHLKSAFTL
jgi:putative endonuclease